MADKNTWEEKAANLLKSQLKLKGVTYSQLVERLAEIGVDEKEANIRNKLSRGEVHCGFYVAMLERDRLLHPVTGSLAAVFLMLLVAGLVSHGRHDHGHGNARNGATTYEAQAAKPEKCTGAAFYEPPCAPDREDAAERRQWAEDQDLKAQRQMAKWTLIMGITAVVGVILSAIGIALIYGTLEATQEATTATREIGENQSKSYAWVHEALISFPSGKESDGQNIRLPGKANISVRITARNEGETPATDVSAWATLQIFSNTGNAFAPIKLEYKGAPTKDPKVRVITKNGEEPLWLFIPDGREPKIQNAFANALDPKNWAVLYGVHSYEIQGILQYRDVFGHWYHSAFKFFGSVNEDGKFNPAFRSEDPKILFLKVNAPRVPDSDKSQ